MRLYYIDESEGPRYYVRSALGVDGERWNELFGDIHAWRLELQERYGIPLSRELHACDLLPLARLVPPIGFHPILRESLLAQPGLAPLLQHRHRLLPPKVHRNSTFYPSGRYLAASCHLILRPPGSLLVAAHALRSA